MSKYEFSWHILIISLYKHGINSTSQYDKPRWKLLREVENLMRKFIVFYYDYSASQHRNIISINLDSSLTMYSEFLTPFSINNWQWEVKLYV